MRKRAPLLLILMLAAGASLAAGCTCSGGQGDHGAPPEASRDFGDTSAPPPDAAPYLALARAIVEHGKEGRTSVPAPPQAPGRRVFLAFYRSDGDAVVATAKAPVLADAVASAAEEIAGKVKDPTKGRLELDVPTGLSGASIEEDQEMPIGSIGLEGILLVGDDGKTAAVLPGEIVERRLFHTGKTTGLSHDKLAPLLATRAGLSEPALPAMRAYRFRADSHVESASHGGVLPVLRGMVAGPGGGRRPSACSVPCDGARTTWSA